jgi:primase-polymerase (primpol)-like protein
MKTLLEPKFDQIPIEIQESFRWAVWKAEPRPNQPGKFNKAPRSLVSGRLISVNCPEYFADFRTCRETYEQGGCSGVGILLSGDGWIGVDIDDFSSISLTQREQISLWMSEAFSQGAYLERSPSGSGFRVIFRGQFFGKGRKAGSLEIYQNGRFLTVTGHALACVAEVATDE